MSDSMGMLWLAQVMLSCTQAELRPPLSTQKQY
jgi:hypothetical protein